MARASKKASAKSKSAIKNNQKDISQQHTSQHNNNSQAGQMMVDQNFRIANQYIKNLSMKNINYLRAFASDAPYNGRNNSEIDVRINEVENSDNFFEIELFLHVAAMDDNDEKIYELDITYAGLTQLQENLRTEIMQNILFIDVPTLLFPYVREIIADHIAKAGYPPFYLNRIDFTRLHQYRINQFLQQQSA